MQIVELDAGAAYHRSGTARIPWSDLAAQQRRRGELVRSLAPGEDVVVRLGDRDEQRGWVLRNTHGRTDGSYVIVLGGALGRRVPVGGGRAGVPRPR